jgi:hypothetical protein
MSSTAWRGWWWPRACRGSRRSGRGRRPACPGLGREARDAAVLEAEAPTHLRCSAWSGHSPDLNPAALRRGRVWGGGFANAEGQLPGTSKGLQGGVGEE